MSSTKKVASAEKAETIPENARLLTVEQVMERLQVSRAQVYRLMQQKRLKTTTLGRSRKVKASTLDAFIHSMVEMMPPKGKRR